MQNSALMFDELLEEEKSFICLLSWVRLKYLFPPLMQGNLEHLVMEEVSRFNCELATNLLFSKYYEL